MKQTILNQIRNRRKVRSRAKISGTAQKPRLTVFRSNLYTSVQLIDDESRKTLVSATTKEFKKSAAPKGQGEKNKMTKLQEAEKLGELIAKRALEKNISGAVYNRRGYKYHGRVKAVAEFARKAGLKI